MSAYQGGEHENISGVPAIGVSIFEGVIIAALNKVMVTFLTAAQPEAHFTIGGFNFVTVVGMEWLLVVFTINVASVLGAYRIKGWLGVILYLAGWLYVASQLTVIGIGIGPIIVGLAILFLYEYLKW